MPFNSYKKALPKTYKFHFNFLNLKKKFLYFFIKINFEESKFDLDATTHFGKLDLKTSLELEIAKEKINILTVSQLQ